MFISQIAIDSLMRQSLIGARADDPVIPERTPRRPRRAARKRKAGHAPASLISTSTTCPPRSVTS